MRSLLFLAVFLTAAACGSDTSTDALPLTGLYVVTESMSSSSVHALTSEERDALIGKNITFGRDSAHFFNVECKDVTYEKDFIPRDQLLREIGYIDERAPLLPAQVVHLDAECADIYLREDGSIMFIWEGDIFVANRKTP